MRRIAGMNTKKGLRNIAAGFLNQFATLLLGVVIPRLVLVHLGSEANGLMNTINQILVYVALLEAGVGTVSMQALYEPIAKADQRRISSIIAATDHFYKRTGTGYFAIILFLSFLFPFTIETEMSRSAVMWVVFLSGMPGVINYYFQGKFKILLQAEGKTYFLTNLATIIYIFTSVSKIILLLNGFGLIALQVMYLVFNIVQVLAILVYMKRHYQWLNIKNEPDFRSISQSKNALVHQVSGLIFSNTDVLILTYFCGLKQVSVYSMYTMLFGLVATLISHVSGINFIFGQTFNSDRKRFLKSHDMYELYYMALSFSLYCVAGIFILPFLSLYTQGVQDINYVDRYLPYLFISTYLLSKGRSSSSQVINYAGNFKQTQLR